MSQPKQPKPSCSRVVLVGLVVSGGNPPEWQIAYAKYNEVFHETDFSEADLNSELGNCFKEEECIETHPPENVNAAITSALEIAKLKRLPLYRVTDTGPLWDCRIYEEMYVPKNSTPPVAG